MLKGNVHHSGEKTKKKEQLLNPTQPIPPKSSDVRRLPAFPTSSPFHFIAALLPERKKERKKEEKSIPPKTRRGESKPCRCRCRALEAEGRKEVREQAKKGSESESESASELSNNTLFDLGRDGRRARNKKEKRKKKKR